MSRRLLQSLLVLSLLISSVLPAQAVVQVELKVTLDSTIKLDAFAPASSFILRFNQAMDPRSSANPLLPYPYLAGASTWDTSRTVLTFTADDMFPADKDYTLYLDPALKSASGVSFQTVQYWELHTKAAPVVSSRTVNSNDARLPVFKLKFDREMDTAAIPALVVEPSIGMKLTWNGSELSVQPEKPLEPGKDYFYSLPKSARGQDRVPLGEVYSWTYHVPEFSLNVNVINTEVLSLHFSQPVRLPGTNPPVSFQPELSGKWKKISEESYEFTPKPSLEPGISYTASLDETVQDSRGRDLPIPPSVQFSVPPPVQSVSPRYNQNDYKNSSYIEIQFSRPMDRSSVEKAFHLQPALEGTIQWSGDTFRFYPYYKISSANGYSASLDTSVKDDSGHPVLVEPYSWSFPTYSLQAHINENFRVTFGQYGANVQVLNASGRRSVLFARTPEVKTVIADLYALDLATFVQRYCKGFQMRYNTNQLIDVSGLENAKHWFVPSTTREVVIPPDVHEGLYILSLGTEEGPDDMIFLALTKTTLTVKRSGEHLFIWASDLNGKNLEKQEIRLYNARGEKVRQADTDENGLVRLSVPKDDEPLLVAARGGDGGTAIAGLDGIWSYWDYQPGISYSPGIVDNDYNAYLYTDRPIYRPGQVVNFKAIVRVDDDVRYTLPPENSPVILRLRDSRKNQLQTQTLALNGFGTLNGQFTLPESGSLGDYTIEAEVDGELFSQTFKVEEYRKPQIELKAAVKNPIYLNGESVQVDIDAGYYFGQPFADKALKIQVFQLSRRFNWWWDGSQDADNRESYTWMQPVSDWNIRTDAEGHAHFITRAELGEEYYRAKSWSDSLEESAFGVQITADDGSGETTSVRVIYRVWNSAYRLSFEEKGWSYPINQAANLTARVVDREGRPVSGSTVRFWLYLWRPSVGDYASKGDLGEAKTGQNGLAALEFTPQLSGSYKITASLVDSAGNRLEVSRWIYVPGKSQDTGSGSASGKLSISSDKTSYKPYETATFAIHSTFSGSALLTFERRRVNRAVPVTLTAPVTLIDVKLSEADAPNVFVKINAWKTQDTNPDGIKEEGFFETIPDSRLLSNILELQVDPLNGALHVDLQPEKGVYSPGDTALVALQVKDSSGKPVKSEVSLALVDESIYALAVDSAKPIYQAFYGRRNLAVETYNSMAPYRYLYQPGRGGGGGDGFEPGPRSNFPDTAVWLPAVQTDSQGRADVKVELPDSLTKWRIVARAVTRDTQVGENTATILVQQEVAVRPIIPDGITSGDKMIFQAMVHNYSDQPRSLDILIAAGLVTINSKTVQKVNLKPGEVVPVRWALWADQVGTTDVTVTASENGETRDAVKLPLSVQPNAINDLQSTSGEFIGKIELPVVVPPDVQDGSYIEVQLSRSIGENLLIGLEYLTGYPYGCVEQTMSRALPNAVVGRALRQLNIPDQGLQNSLPKLIQSGLSRLYGMQHEDGGWGWWNYDLSDEYQTAWVVYGLGITRDAGYDVEEKVITDGANYLAHEVKSTGSKLDKRTRAYILYSLALSGHAELDLTLQAAQEKTYLDNFSLAGLALALEKMDRHTEALDLVKWLSLQAVEKDEKVYWPSGIEDGEYHDKTMASTTRTTAQVLAALLQVQPDSQLIPGIVRYLLGERRVNGWGTTNETAYALMALSDYLLQSKEGSQDTGYSISLNGQSIKQGQMKPDDLSTKIRLERSELQTGLNVIQIEQSSSQKLYYAINSHNLIGRSPTPPAGLVKINRRYTNQTTIKGKPAPIKVGDLITIELEITLPDSASYLMIEDTLPAGFEALNEHLTNTTYVPRSEYSLYLEGEYVWERYGYNQKEIRGNKVTFFKTQAGIGTMKITYTVRATHIGQFNALPVQVSAMYDPLVWGRSASNTLEVKE